MDSYSDFLFAHGSYISGVARLLDLFGVLDDYNVSATPELADARALFADWRTVGEDLAKGLDLAAKEMEAVQPFLFRRQELNA